jgi:site-specific DNA-cytosine methylase
MASNDNKINCLELFSGCGGLGYGFHKEGFNIVCASELEDKIARTYALNFPETNVIVGDIRDPEIKSQIYQTFENPVSPISCDIIIGGPPCVAYSMAGKRNSRDPRGQLFNDYIDIVKRLQPTIFVMENVKGILSMKHDHPTLSPENQVIADHFYALENTKLNLQHLRKKAKSDNDMDAFREYSIQIKDIQKQMKSIETATNSFKVYVTDIIKQRFHELGYAVTMQLMNAADYGVPQKTRTRHICRRESVRDVVPISLSFSDT